jgi:triacylglycerol lipase
MEKLNETVINIDIDQPNSNDVNKPDQIQQIGEEAMKKSVEDGTKYSFRQEMKSKFSKISPHIIKPIKMVWNAIRSIAIEIVSLVGSIVLFPFKLSSSDPKENHEAPSNKPPVLFIHGFMHNSSFARYYKSQLEKNRTEMEERGEEVNYGSIYTIDLGSPFHSLEDYLELIDQRVKEIQKQTGCQEIQLVGHSMGGILSTLYAQRHTNENLKIKRVITIGSPLAGTSMSMFGRLFSKAAQQMGRHSKILQELRENVLTNDRGTRFCHIGGTSDFVVPHQDSAWIDANPNAENHRLDGIGHMGLLFSPRVAKHMHEFLQRAPSL